MDIIAEILMELVGTAVVEGGMSVASDCRRPVWLRVLILALLGLSAAVVFAVILLVGIAAVRAYPLIALALFALDVSWVFLCVRRFRKVFHTLSRK